MNSLSMISILGMCYAQSVFHIPNKERGIINMAKSNTKQTSKRVASVASKILKDDRYSAKAKTAAGSALSQTRPTKKK